MSFRTCRSVGESSTINILRMDIFPPWFFDPTDADAAGARNSSRLTSALRGGTIDVRRDGFEEALFRERLGQVLVRSHHAAARAVEQSVLRRQHDHGRAL